MPDQKRCAGPCGRDLDVGAFSWDKAARNGQGAYKAQCRDCTNARATELREAKQRGEAKGYVGPESTCDAVLPDPLLTVARPWYFGPTSAANDPPPAPKHVATPPPEFTADIPADAFDVTVVVTDRHAETKHPALWANFLDWLADFRARQARPIRFLDLGDFGEWESMNQHAPSPALFKDDVAQVNETFDQLDAILASCDNKVVLEGNHETRFPRWLKQNAGNLKGITSIPEELRLEQRGWRWVGERAQTAQSRWGLLKALHGHQSSGRHGGPKHFAMKNADLYGRHPGELIVCGHHHRKQSFGKVVENGTITAMGLPCMRSLAPEWMQGTPDGWELGFAVIYQGATFVQPIVVTANAAGQFLWDGRLYGKREAA